MLEKSEIPKVVTYDDGDYVQHSMSAQDERQNLRRKLVPENTPYVLRKVLEDVPLQADNTSAQVSITCVEHWNGNLYIGTSACEIIHLVALPGESEDEAPTYILASRLQPSGHANNPSKNGIPGVQQILVLPGPLRACILCNGVVSFYTLPELSPASPSKEPTGIQWIGGLDENQGVENPEGHVVMLASSRRIMLIRISERYRPHGSVDYPNCLQSVRRDTIACVANDTNYALLEVEHQQQIPLVPISSVALATDVSDQNGRQSSSSRGHSRSISLGDQLSATHNTSSLASPGQQLEVPDPERRSGSPGSVDSHRSGSRPRSSTDLTNPSTVRERITRLKPHILSTSPTEFMVTTGTNKEDTGVGVFFNLDGDPSRGAIEFQQYPDDILAYDFEGGDNLQDSDQQVIVALFEQSNNKKYVEIQDLSGQNKKSTMLVPGELEHDGGGLHQCLSMYKHSFSEVTELLRAKRYKPSLSLQSLESDPRTKASIMRLEQETALFEDQSPQPSSPTPEYEQTRSQEERRFVSRLGQSTTKAVVWRGTQIWQILRSPIMLGLENGLLRAGILKDGKYQLDSVEVPKILSVLGSIRDQEPTNETDFLTLKYIRQKASLVLFLHLQTSLKHDAENESACHIVRSALQEGDLDPRVVLLLVPPLAREVIQGPNGIWLHSGITELLDDFKSNISIFQDAPFTFWLMIRQFLSDWQEKRGYGSIMDERYVFDSVDAGLLHVLLYLDTALPAGSGMQSSTRVKLNNVVDYWKADFPRAIILLEHYQRLYVLSQLYQSRKLSKDVLATWKRIAEGEKDADSSRSVDFVENKIRDYLVRIRNANLVQEYGVWLARRNPDLAIQVFTDDESRVKLAPAQVVTMLKQHAPSAVQQYLEHLVFAKHLDQYADDLIGYYLDSVLNVLEESTEAKDSLEQSYAAYRGLESPKPTYLNFISQNSSNHPWWRSRLRLLQLLGSGGYASKGLAGGELTYSVDKVLERLKPFSNYLVSESIVLDARQGRHKEALSLLTHGLGDYDTAVRYCYFGGPTSMSAGPVDADTLPSKDAQQKLFQYLFHEFLKIENLEDRLDRTSHLLGTFASWFDPLHVFDAIPQDWPVDVLADFLLRSFRAATSAKNQALIVKALSAAQNLQNQAALIDLCEKLGPKFDLGNDRSKPTVTQGLDASVK